MLEGDTVKSSKAAVLLILGWCGTTRAQPEPPPDPAQSERRPPPAHQARGYEKPPGTEPEDVALFVPRLVLALPRYALRVVFYPIDRTLAFLDRHAVIEHVEDLLYNDERTAGIVPKLSADTFFGPTVGVKAFHEDLADHGERGDVQVSFGGRYQYAWQLAFRADRFGGSRLWLESVARYEAEPGLLFQGIGDPEPRRGGSALDPRGAAVRTRFRQRRLLSLLRAGRTFGEPRSLVKVGATAIFNDREFGHNTRGDEPSTEAVYDTALLPGYDEGADTLEGNLNLVVDTRDVHGATSRGVYVEAFVGGVPKLREFGFWHYGMEVTSYFDLYERTRILVLRVALEGVAGDPETIPFSSLARLGGPHRLRGYPLDRFRDEKATVSTLEYHYPIHQYVSGSLYVDAGKVESRLRDLLDGCGWRAGFGGGFIVRSRDRVLFTLDAAYGEGLELYLTTDPLRAFANRNTEL